MKIKFHFTTQIVNDLPNKIVQLNVLSFADDTKLTKQICKENDCFLLQKDLDYIIEWSKNNKMTLNNDKFELLCHKPSLNKNLNLINNLPFFNQFHSYNVSNGQILPSNSVRDLGIHITPDLNWDVHIDKICKKARQISGWILHVFYARDQNTMLTLFNALARSVLEYCPEIWNPHKVKDIVCIEQVQRTFTAKIRGVSHLNYWERLSFLKIYSLQRRRERLMIIVVWKILNRVYPNCVNFEFKLNKRLNSLKAILQPMPKATGSLLTKYEESFVVKAAKL